MKNRKIDKISDWIFFLVCCVCLIAFVNKFVDFDAFDTVITWLSPLALCLITLPIWNDLKSSEINEGVPHRQVCLLWWVGLYLMFRFSYKSLASNTIVGFQVMSFFGIILTMLLITFLVIELYYWISKKSNIETEPKFIALGLSIFIFHSYNWHKDAFVVHYGVEKIDHYLEKPIYDAEYYAAVRNVNKPNAKEYIVLSDLHITHEEEYYGSYENISGQEQAHFGIARRIIVKKIKFTNGGWVNIDFHDEPIDMFDGGIITDVKGRTWAIRILKDKDRYLERKDRVEKLLLN